MWDAGLWEDAALEMCPRAVQDKLPAIRILNAVVS